MSRTFAVFERASTEQAWSLVDGAATHRELAEELRPRLRTPMAPTLVAVTVTVTVTVPSRFRVE